MKLNNAQIQALAEKLKQEIDATNLDKYNRKIEAFRRDGNFRKQCHKLWAAFKEVHKMFLDAEINGVSVVVNRKSLGESTDLEQFVTQYATMKAGKSPAEVNLGSIKTEIVYSTITVTDLESLKGGIISKFTA